MVKVYIVWGIGGDDDKDTEDFLTYGMINLFIA